MSSANRLLSVAASAACALVPWCVQAQSAAPLPPPTSQEVYFCPASSNPYLGETAPIACSAATCVGGKSQELTPEQKQFLESQKGDCRYLDDREKGMLLPETPQSL